MTFIVVSIMGFCLETHRWGRTPVATPPVSDSSTPSPSSTDTSVPSQDSVILSAMTILQSTVSTSAPTTTADPFGIMHNPNQFEGKNINYFTRLLMYHQNNLLNVDKKTPKVCSSEIYSRKLGDFFENFSI